MRAQRCAQAAGKEGAGSKATTWRWVERTIVRAIARIKTNELVLVDCVTRRSRTRKRKCPHGATNPASPLSPYPERAVQQGRQVRFRCAGEDISQTFVPRRTVHHRWRAFIDPTRVQAALKRQGIRKCQGTQGVAGSGVSSHQRVGELSQAPKPQHQATRWPRLLLLPPLPRAPRCPEGRPTRPCSADLGKVRIVGKHGVSLRP